MPRRRLYHTESQKLAAKQATERRSYEKNKTEYAKRRKIRRAQHAEASRSLTERQHNLKKKKEVVNRRKESDGVTHSRKINPIQGAVCSDSLKDPKKYESNPVQFCLDRARLTAVKLDKLTGNSVKHFLESIFSAYTTQLKDKGVNDKDIINDPIVRLGRWQRTLQRYFGRILQDAGVGSELREVEDILKRVNGVVHRLEDLLCHAMLGPDTLAVAHDKRKLMYQLKVS